MYYSLLLDLNCLALQEIIEFHGKKHSRLVRLNILCFSQVPVDLVVDHSVQVDVARSENAIQANMELEFQRNKERFAFLKWGSSAFQNMLVVPPGSGIVHQVGLSGDMTDHMIP